MNKFGIPCLAIAVAVAAACSQSVGPTSPAAPSVTTSAGALTLASASKGRLADTPVASTVNGSATGSFQVASDGNTTYTNGVSGVESIIQTSNTCCNDWVLGTSATRGLFISFANQVSSGVNGGAPFTSQIVDGAGVIVFCHDTVTSSFPGMTAGEQLKCNANVRFTSGKDTWRIVNGATDHPNTDQMLVTCNTADTNNSCNDWTVAPSNPSGLNTVDLVLADGSRVIGQYGTYRMGFSFHVTRTGPWQ